jgi:hypothetical protein
MTELKNIPKDLWIHKILPYIQEPLIKEINILRDDIIKMKNIAAKFRIKCCEFQDCHLDLEAFYICNGCDIYLCRGHMISKNKESWCEVCYNKGCIKLPFYA